jgi:short-subunit dehydrogenase
VKVSFQNKKALVTGGSSGIGLEIAAILAREGADVCILASDAVKLEAAAVELSKKNGRSVSHLSADLSDPSSPGKIQAALASRGFVPDILVNNAGFGLYGEVLSNDLAGVRRMIEVNVTALVALTKLFVPAMKQRGWGRVLNVASTAAFQPVPLEAVYAATKAFVLSFSEALAEETAGTGVRVTCFCPGPTRTNFFKNGGFATGRAIQTFFMESPRVARIGVEAMRSGRTLAAAGARNSVIPFLERFAPRKMVTKIAKKMVQ